MLFLSPSTPLFSRNVFCLISLANTSQLLQFKCRRLSKLSCFRKFQYSRAEIRVVTAHETTQVQYLCICQKGLVYLMLALTTLIIKRLCWSNRTAAHVIFQLQNFSSHQNDGKFIPATLQICSKHIHECMECIRSVRYSLS